MRIAFFAETFLPKWDGVSITLCHVLHQLARQGHESIVFAPRGGPERYAEAPIIGLSGFPFPLYPELRLVPPLINVQDELEAFRPHLVHLVNPASLGLAGLRAARSLGLPVIASYQTDIPGYASSYGLSLLNHPLWAFFSWLHNKMDLNLCPSEFTRRELEAHGFRRMRVWPGGVDIARFDPAKRSDDWRMRLSGGHPEAPLLLYVGRLAAEKRVDWLRPVLDAHPEARLAIVGDGPERRNLERCFAGANAILTGYLHGEDLAQAYASADLFVFPSASETFGTVVVEAMASGLPVIAPRFGGPVDLVTEGVTGSLFDRDDLAGLIGLVGELLADPARIRAWGEAARRAAQDHSWDASAACLLGHYADLLADFRAPRAQQRKRPESYALPWHARQPQRPGQTSQYPS